MSITQNIMTIKSKLPENVNLVAVSKTKPVADLMEAYQAGQRIFGENKIQEMTDKWEALPKDIQWHMIGHVQSNKVKYMAPYVTLIHGVDSLKLLEEINKQASKNNRIIDCLLQVFIAKEETKFGLDETEIKDILKKTTNHQSFQNINVIGLMGMASFTNDFNQISTEFNYLKSLFDQFKSFNGNNINFSVLSMGMSGDYETAIACGSNMVRIGSHIFGGR